MLRRYFIVVSSLFHSWTCISRQPLLGAATLGAIAMPGLGPVALPQAVHGVTQSPPTLAEQGALVMTCTGTIEANNIDFTLTYSSESGFSEIELRRNGAKIASALLSFSGRNDDDYGVWRGTTTGQASLVVIHLSEKNIQPGDTISVGHDGQWGRGQCAGAYWQGNGA